jgi:hypothetical protein
MKWKKELESACFCRGEIFSPLISEDKAASAGGNGM